MSVVTKLGSGNKKAVARKRRHTRVRKRVTGTAARPRLVVSRSSRHLFVQVVDDSARVSGTTLPVASYTITARFGAREGSAKVKGRAPSTENQITALRPMRSPMGPPRSVPAAKAAIRPRWASIRRT